MSGFAQYTLALCAILLLASLAGLVCEKAGVVNIGIEGMMTIGALIVAMIGSSINKDSSHVHNGSQIWVVLVAGLLTGIFAMLHAFPSITLRSNQIISGTAINILALGLGMFFATSRIFGDQGSVISTFYNPIYIGSIIPIWLVFAVLIAIGLTVFFKLSKQGMRYAMVGENPNAVDAAGISVNKYRYIAVFCSGVLAGLAGGVMITTVVMGGNFGGTTMGMGFLAMAIMIFGQWKIHWISLGVIIFAFLFTLGSRLGTLSFIPEGSWLITGSTIFKVLPFVITIATMVIFSKSSRAPAANGIPFDKSKR
ncbi:ABC transporter permease [Mesoplasma seiffertii]|uniref:ABC transporter permease n=1 Tax=Mesoplasma seiffertii TaxID=28224 RepID=UPI00055BC8F9|nr:ABC transporter permease [Mesoplasma seiffertii]